MQSGDTTAYWVALVAIIGSGVLASSVALRVTAFLMPHWLSPESADRGIWILAAGFTALGVTVSLTPIARKRIDRLTGSIALGLIALAVVAVGIAWTEYVADLPTEIQEGWWRGFGPVIALGTLVLVPIVAFLGAPSWNPLIRYLTYVGIVVAIVWYLPTIINPPWSFDPHHSNPVLNDVLGPFVGNFPLADQVPQYTALLGYPLVPLLTIVTGTLGSKWSILVSSAYLSTLAIATVCLIVWIATRSLPRKVASLSPLLVLPVMLASGEGGGSIGQSFSALPARLMFPVLILGLLIAWWPLTSWWHNVVIGLLSGIAVVNNPEFGFVSLVALVIALLLGARNSALRSLSFIGLGALIGVLGLLVAVHMLSSGFKVSLFAAYVRAFGEGSLSLAMPSAGTFLIILALPAAALAYAAYWLRSGPLDRQAIPGLVAVYSGVMTLGTFAYYVGRSSSTGQLQALLPFFALSLVSTIGMIGLPRLTPRLKDPQLLTGVLAAAVPAFAIAAILQAPDPRSQWGKIIPNSSESFLLAGREVALELAESLPRMSEAYPDQNLAVALDTGNLVTALTGIPNKSPLSYVGDSNLSSTLSAAMCTSLSSWRGLLVVDIVQASAITSACPQMVRVVYSDERFALLQAKDSTLT